MERNNDIDILQRAEMKQIPFTTPDGYFDTVEERLRERTFQTQPDGKWGSFRRALRAGLTLAASFLLVAGMGWGIMKLTEIRQDRIAANQQTELTEEGNMMLDSLVSRFGAIEVADVYHNSIAGYYPDVDEDSDEDYDALEEYITLMVPSYPGLLAEEITNFDKY